MVKKGVLTLGELAFAARFEVNSAVVTDWSSVGTRCFRCIP